jgi:NAD+ kinase
MSTPSGLRLAMVSRDDSPRVDEARRELLEFLLREYGLNVPSYATPDDFNPSPDEPLDLVVVLGGDGTILRTCRQLGQHQRPMLGVNLGRLGFLADLSPNEFCERFPRFVAREYQVVHHLMYSCRWQSRSGQEETWLGLNEVAVQAGAALCLLRIQLEIDGERVNQYSCDGLIVSTPVGSTAHSLAAGGPILRQDLSAFVITPICPHTLTNRPVVDRADSVYRLTVPDAPAGTMLVVDGQIKHPLEPGDVVEIRRAPVTFQLARLTDHSYYTTLRRKLGWSGQPLYGGQWAE